MRRSLSLISMSTSSASGKHRHGSGRSMDSALGFGHRHALHPVHAAFEFQLGIGATALHLQRRFLVAAKVTFATATGSQFSSPEAGNSADTCQADRHANRAASSPPVPARISTMAEESSAASRGKSCESQVVVQLFQPVLQLGALLLRHAAHFAFAGRIGDQRFGIARSGSGPGDRRAPFRSRATVRHVRARA